MHTVPQNYTLYSQHEDTGSAFGRLTREAVTMLIDRRYSIRPEFCGHPKAQFVVRFCGEYVGSAHQKHDARDIASSHASRRRRDLQIPVPHGAH